jgi:hypothetical protein
MAPQPSPISSTQPSNSKLQSPVLDTQPVSQIQPSYRPISSSTNPLASNPTNSPLSIALALPKPARIQKRTSSSTLGDVYSLGGEEYGIAERAPRAMRERGAVERTLSEDGWDRDILEPEEDDRAGGCGCWSVSYSKMDHCGVILM